MSAKSEALRLADALEMSSIYRIRCDAAAELRRLHAENEAFGIHLSERMKDLARVEAQRDALQAAIDACAIYLKEGETPAQRIERDHRDSLALMRLLAQEKLKSETLMEFVLEVRRSGDTRLASMAIAVIAKAEGQ